MALVNDLVFWSGGEHELEQSFNEPLQHEEIDIKQPYNCENDSKMLLKRPSVYVQLFEEMVSTVLKHEPTLFTDDEWIAFEKFSALDYPARYLLVRLSLRKHDKWHRLDSLKYQAELGDGIAGAIADLCAPFDAGIAVEDSVGEPEHDEREIIDLTGDDDDFGGAGPSNKLSVEPEHVPEPELGSDLTVFAYDERKMMLHEMLTCLTVDELKGLAKQVKLKTTQNRSSFISSLLISATTQSTLDFPVITKTSLGSKSSIKPTSKANNSPEKPLAQTRLTFPVIGKGTLTANRMGIEKRKEKGRRQPKVHKTQEERLRALVTNVLGKCIRLNPRLCKLFKRVDLVYFRSTDATPTLLTPALLTTFKKRTYPAYTYTRTADIWRTREELVKYEEALELEASIDAMAGDEGGGGNSGVKVRVKSRTPAKGHESVIPITPGGVAQKQNGEEDGDGDGGSGVAEEGTEQEVPQRVLDALRVKALFETCIYPRWKELVQAKRDAEVRGEVKIEVGDAVHSKRAGLERFDCGFIYTRMIQKCAHAFGVLQERALELQVLDELLAQRFWRCGKRGRWYERRALILMTHCETKKEEQTLWKAREGVIDGLLDEDTHMVYRPALVRRLTRLEKLLKLPSEMRHISQGGLLKPKEVYVEGIRIWRRASSLILDQGGRIVVDRMTTPNQQTSEVGDRAWGALSPASVKSERRAGGMSVRGSGKWKVPDAMGKSVWRGRHAEEVNVETLALQHYENMGYKGFHSEGNITRTIFGLLFWDIIFASVPGAFETPYQSAPLDIADDAFYRARKDLIEERVHEIREGKAREIVERVDAAQRERGTWCVGVRWDLFERQDLVEIVECLGGEPLSIICKIFCEDYAQRGSGVPDLFIWNAEKGTCKFVEVKGPGDTLQENQKIWIDVLLGADVGVEVCKVVEHGKIPKKGRAKTAKGNGKGKGKALMNKKAVVESDEEPIVWEGGDDEGMNHETSSTKRQHPDDELPVLSPTSNLASSPRTKGIINYAEVLITTSPPAKKRRT